MPTPNSSVVAARMFLHVFLLPSGWSASRLRCPVPVPYATFPPESPLHHRFTVERGTHERPNDLGYSDPSAIFACRPVAEPCASHIPAITGSRRWRSIRAVCVILPARVSALRDVIESLRTFMFAMTWKKQWVRSYLVQREHVDRHPSAGTAGCRSSHRLFDR